MWSRRCWVSQTLLCFYSIFDCLFRRGWRSIHCSLLWNSCEKICSSAAMDTDTFGLFIHSMHIKVLIRCLIKSDVHLTRSNPIKSKQTRLTWQVVSPQKSSPCSVRRSSCLFLRRGSNMRQQNNTGQTEKDETELIFSSERCWYVYIHSICDLATSVLF